MKYLIVARKYTCEVHYRLLFHERIWFVFMEELFRIGVITEAHGIQGEFKVYPTTDDPARIKKLKEIILDDGKEKRILHPVGQKFSKNMVILKVEEITDRNEAERLRKKELYVTRENAVKCKKDEYYISDLIGLTVIDEADEKVGVVTDVFATGANDVYEIKKEDGTELLLPAIKQCILEVNVDEGYVRVHVLEGL